MVPNRIDAMRAERLELLRFCRELDDAEWQTSSMAAGWRVQDVVAHMGSVSRALFSPSAMRVVRSNDVERANEILVDRCRGASAAETLADYERWSRRTITTARLVERTPVASVPVSIAGLGRFPVGLMLTGAMVFDHHTHLRHDIAPALGRPAPGTDEIRMAVVLEWMLAVLSSQLHTAAPEWFDQAVSLQLHGPGGGTWLIRPDGAIEPCDGPRGAAHVVADAVDFPEWATQRAPWRDGNVTSTGDADRAAQLLDFVNVV